MRLIYDLTPRDAAQGLAVDEALLESARCGGADAVRVWVSERAVVVGRSQAAASECDRAALARRSVPLVRRISGGGAVYHYPGNLNVSLTLASGRMLGSADDAFAWFGQALASGVRTLGLPAESGSRCVTIDERKVSGAAQARRGVALLLHATLLVQADEIQMSELLLAMREGYAPAGTRSRPSETTTLSDALGRRVTMADAACAVTRGLGPPIGRQLVAGVLAPHEAALAERLMTERYGRLEWNESR